MFTRHTCLQCGYRSVVTPVTSIAVTDVSYCMQTFCPFLPARLSREEIAAIVAEAVTKLNATNVKQMKDVMKEVRGVDYLGDRGG